MCSIPGLKNVAGEWVHDPGEKADLFAETFAKKCVLAEREDNRYTNLERCNESQWQLLVRTTENAKRQLTSLRVDSATGPDAAPAVQTN